MILISCQDEEEEKVQEKFFSNPDYETSGLDFTNTLKETRDQNILDYLYFYNGGGVSIGDINNDGLPDIYFTGNQVKNKLFLNKGNLQFEDITEKAGVAGNSTWNTGTTMADVNGDGLLDIYVSAVVGVNGFRGHNELFINNGDLSFTESSAEYGLDMDTYSSQAAFFDLENDGDLDVYILNHAVHTNESFGPASIRNNRVYESGDKLLLNENGKFIDISEEAGIYGGANSYGLGITTADFNNDGYTDIYIGNDFHEDDYYYINNGDGAFSENLKQFFGHTSRFSMGNDAADVNNDGFMDLITLDMLPEDENVLKSSAGDDNVNLDRFRIEKLGYHPQYTRNMLQMNKGGNYFSETALMSGVAATDWSWGPLFADYDQDGKQDLFISNGIPKRPNDLDYVKYTSNEQIQNKLDKTTLVDNDVLDKMPSGAVTNYIFKGEGDGNFDNRSAEWIKNDSIISTGVAYGDLDGDGDLDIVTNNINQRASIYINDYAEGDHLKIRLKSDSNNTFGIGSKAILYTSEGKQARQLYTTKAYQSSSEPILHFGFKNSAQLDSLIVIWPNSKTQTLLKPEKNKTLVLKEKDAKDSADYSRLFKSNNTKGFKKLESDFGITYEHEENRYNDFDMQKLIPHQMSDLGPSVKVADINNDGKEDIIFGASRFKPVEIFIQQNGNFKKQDFPEIARDSLAEDQSIAIADFNADGKQDLFFASGGGESVGRNEWLLDRLYLGNNSSFKKDSLLPKIYNNSAVIRTADYDNDGDQDILVGSNSQNYDYGAIPKSYLLQNNNGKFKIVQEDLFDELGMINDLIFTDIDGDKDLDILAVGEWMSPVILENSSGKYSVNKNLIKNKKLNGLWQKVTAADIDHDGDMDYLLGNWGLNTKLNASEENPMRMYYKDFDNNGLTETLLATEKNGNYYFPYGLDEMASQLSQMLRKRFTKYKDFAGKKIDEIMTKEELDSARLLEVHTLASGYLENTGSGFSFREFSRELQSAPIRAMLSYDFNNDGKNEVLIGGNYFGVTPYHGRFDALGGSLMLNENKILDSDQIQLNLSQKSVKDFSIIQIDNKSYLIITINNSKIEIYEFDF
ncbi:VCBS repeat-containing protein [Christiangramia sp. SM2212]|uniref:VCBS repeat-containing protein n=1 Tax=Christiangramia sediminicola TaxID=3073267 RepID=A0ABU1ENQ2_9FLAO|nr:VCBS repeat-containing protein [Christiangramia sp. SM2212]MDR5590013.1 VCBS repeat-containing protein [Christiangramia sp. SM2212]